MTHRIDIAALAFACYAVLVLSGCEARLIRSNGLVVVSDEHVTLVDTAWNDEQTDAIARWALAELGRSATHTPRAPLLHAHAR